MADKISVKDMLAQIQQWHLEVSNMRNDGWTQQAYRDKIEALHSQLSVMVEKVELTTDEKKEKKAFRPDPREDS